MIAPSNPAPPAKMKNSAHDMARLALWLSVGTFLLPLGIAAIVLGHMSERRLAESDETGNGRAMARAALWIAYLQMVFVTISGLFFWSIFHETAEGFRGDAMVQRVFRASDQMKPLDPDSAREAGAAAVNTMYQLMAIEEQVRKHREDGSYSCQLSELIQIGAEGATDAEKRAFGLRIVQSPYIFELRSCNPNTTGIPSAAYHLTAVPRPPRMPENSALFCSDETGVIRVVRGGISLDCLKNGEVVR